MKKIIWQIAVLALSLACLRLEANAAMFPASLLPCHRIYNHLKTFDHCPEDRECVELSGVIVNKFRLQEGGHSICVIRKGDPDEGFFVGTLSGLVGENASEILTSVNSDDHGEQTLFYAIQNVEAFLDYSGFLLTIDGEEKQVVFTNVVEAAGRRAEIPFGLSDAAREELERIDAENFHKNVERFPAREGEEAREAPAPHQIPGGVVNEEALREAMEDIQEDDGKKRPVVLPDFLKKLFRGAKFGANQNASAGENQEGSDIPVAGLQANEVNPVGESGCSLNASLNGAASNGSNLAYVWIAFAGVVLADIRRRIRKREDR